ncbi:MAG TPA: hypothetical protein VEV19_02460 [Ktedonobacteraceae bacterium]|nr:hypothetical protein [Ktedonobacteraceae bacterium]
MRIIAVILGLGLIPLGFIIGSYIRIGDGSAAVIGAIIGFVLFCLLSSLGIRNNSEFLTGSKEAMDKTSGLRKTQEFAIEEQLRNTFRDPHGF